MLIVVNNKQIEIDNALVMSELIRQQNINSQAIAVAVNKKIIHRENWCEYRLCDGDNVDIVTVVAGG